MLQLHIQSDRTNADRAGYLRRPRSSTYIYYLKQFQ